MPKWWYAMKKAKKKGEEESREQEGELGIYTLSQAAAAPKSVC